MRMNSIYTLISDSDLLEEFLSSLRNRSLDHKFLYQGTGAKNYYILKEKDIFFDGEKNLSDENFFSFFERNFSLKEKMAFISL